MAPGSAAARLEILPPGRLAVGRGTAFAIAGYCYVPGRRTRRLAVRIGGAEQTVTRFGLPRIDVHDHAAGNGDRGSAFRSGFVTLVKVGPVAKPDRHDIELVLSPAGGAEETVRVGAIDLEPQLHAPGDAPAPSFGDNGGPRVAICMATYEPPAELLERQIASLKAQTHGNWICVISDDASGDESFERLRELTDGDPRFAVSRSPERLGFYRNFERALSMTPGDADYATLCDQDDRWHPEKLGRLLEAIGEAQLAYSDARIVTPSGELVRPSYWTERRNNHTNFASLLLANSVTGAASLFRRDLLDDALPFPPKLAQAAFHDHWLAIVALARGEITYVDEPLYDYVQHESAVIGHLQANRRPRTIRRHLIDRLRNPTSASRAVYYYDWHQQLLFGEVVRLRCWDRMGPSKRRALQLLLSADDRVTGLAWLLGRRARRLSGHDETLDRELFYGHALVRRRLFALWNVGRTRPGRLLPRDESVPTESERAARP